MIPHPTPQDQYLFEISYVYWVSAHGHLNMNRNLACMGAYPGYNFIHLYKLLHLTPWNVVDGRLPGSGCMPGSDKVAQACIVKLIIIMDQLP